MLCTGVQTLQKIKPNQQWPTIHGEGPQHENHCNAQGQNIQEEFNNSSSSRQLQLQVQDQLQSKFQEHTINKHVMLWSSAAGVFHMALPSFSWPLGSSIIGSSMYLSASYLQHVQIKCKQVARTSQKQSSEKLSTSWTAKPWQLWKLLHTSSNESTCVQLHASDIQLVTKWKQLTSNSKTVKWTSHELTSQDMKNPKLLQLSNTYKTYAQLLQDSWTASANRTGSPDNSSLHSFCKQLGTDSFCCS